jgi:hypothetical protein
MTARFSKFAALDISGKTAEYTIYEAEAVPDPTDLTTPPRLVKPVLVLRPTGLENPKFFNEWLREFGGDQRELRAKLSNPDAELVSRTRSLVRRLFPQYVVAGWRHVFDDDGNAVPFSESACFELFEHLPGDVIDGIRSFCDDPASFRGRGGAARGIDAGAVAGN